MRHYWIFRLVCIGIPQPRASARNSLIRTLRAYQGTPRILAGLLVLILDRSSSCHVDHGTF
jgi:hypothetical protein